MSPNKNNYHYLLKGYNSFIVLKIILNLTLEKNIRCNSYLYCVCTINEKFLAFGNKIYP